ncbi:MAG: Hsp20/alpha crystallin family protein [Anaerolineaceae bacterium]
MIIVKIISNPNNRDFVISSNPYLSEGLVHQGRITRTHLWRPPTDVIECEHEFIVRVEVAGMDETDFSITLDKNLLIIRGTRNETADRIAFHQMEVRFGEFATTAELPNTIDVETAYAEYENGFLQVILPKKYPTTLEIGE